MRHDTLHWARALVPFREPFLPQIPTDVTRDVTVTLSKGSQAATRASSSAIAMLGRCVRNAFAWCFRCVRTVFSPCHMPSGALQGCEMATHVGHKGNRRI